VAGVDNEGNYLMMELVADWDGVEVAQPEIDDGSRQAFVRTGPMASSKPIAGPVTVAPACFSISARSSPC
jgi:hypothetical protein